jgi:ketosteroid isomerase-like protein
VSGELRRKSLAFVGHRVARLALGPPGSDNRASRMSERDDFRSDVLARQTEAERAFHQGDAGPRMQMWSRRDPVTLFGAIGMFKSGWDDLSETFEWVASRFSDVTDYSYEVVAFDVVGDMAYAVGYERFTGSVAGRPAKEVTVRSTHVYRREDGEWKIVHRHGDNPPQA